MQPCKNIFFTSKFCYLLFCNPTHKTGTGTANRWGTTNSEPPGPIIMIGESETLTSSQILFITLFSAGAHRCGAVYQPPHPVQLCCAKTIFRHAFNFLHLILLYRITYWAPLYWDALTTVNTFLEPGFFSWWFFHFLRMFLLLSPPSLLLV